MATPLNLFHSAIIFASALPPKEDNWQILSPSFYYLMMQQFGSFMVFMIMMTVVCLGMMCLSEIKNGRK